MDLVTKKDITKKKSRLSVFWKGFKNQKMLYLMSIPFVAWVFVFNYLPVWGWTMAFQNYIPGKAFWEQEWVGLQHFIQLFQDERFFLALRNTLAMSFLGLLFGFTIPIIFAILLNEVRNSFFKRVTQTVTYLPHFVSWVVVAGIVTKMLSTDGGIINDLLVGMGILDQPYQFMADGKWFWGIVTVSDIWKEMGWNAIIFLAAIAGLDPQLYEAAKVDGANRFRQIWHITLPGIRPTILVVLILNIGHLIQIGFEKQMLLSNPLVIEYAEVLELYALNYGIGLGQFSYGTAIGIFNSVVSIVLLLLANGIFKRYSNQSVM
ncbi:carbohydrate ABC transporter membrane protein 1, CUT1 family [Gracilibacillus ureilyticus]|uniref:Carbohydrate ABC transporter membrane protein 1, CUT1 family n=1 Tax=Gracilibacillus ureilyticus TaxID=531814 RepID=A0A1H9PLI4_9BACI|nr:sugar ABC transporter permease [Gracilibacillus ureilyticus]SER48950.1 carbohydrate ABC transporter membrane protein 1, CUT1 family [Gracilibacillus ureilyticus]